MDDSMLEMIYQDLEEIVPAPNLPIVRSIYRALGETPPQEVGDAAAQVALLAGITERISPDMHEHMCRQRGYDMDASFPSRAHMICYTSAEFARERYNVPDQVYEEIRRFADQSYSSAVKEAASRLLRRVLLEQK